MPAGLDFCFKSSPELIQSRSYLHRTLNDTQMCKASYITVDLSLCTRMLLIPSLLYLYYLSKISSPNIFWGGFYTLCVCQRTRPVCALPEPPPPSRSPPCVTYIFNNYLIIALVLKMDQELNIEHLVLTIVFWLCFPHNLPRICILT